MSEVFYNQSNQPETGRIQILQEMEKQFDLGNSKYFLNLLNNDDKVVRTRAICVLAEIAGENSVEYIAEVLKNDIDPLVRHEAAFSLGQLGFTSAIGALSRAIRSDHSFFVRHEAAIALGVIGSEDGREALTEALEDVSEEVRESANIALANIDYITITRRTNRFSKMTGG